MKTKIFAVLACLVISFSLAMPAFASDIHEDANVTWEYDGEYYGLAAWNTGSYIRMTGPMYVTWDDGIVLIFDPDDFTDYNRPEVYFGVCAYKPGSGAAYKEIVFGKATVAERADGSKYLMYRFDKAYTYQGLVFSSLTDFYDCLDKDNLSLYYLETVDADFNSASDFKNYVASQMVTQNILIDIGIVFTAAIGWVAAVSSVVTNQPILLLFAVLCLVGLGIGMYSRLKSVNK